LTTGTPAGSGESPERPEAEVVSEGGGETETWTEPRPLTVREQKRLFKQLQRGMSPSLACTALGISLESARLTLGIDARFHRKCGDIPDTLTENVRSAVYSKAMKGMVTAQALWLKEEATRKSAQPGQALLSPDDLLAELERLAEIKKALQSGTDAE
jgi:hypothetical protein